MAEKDRLRPRLGDTHEMAAKQTFKKAQSSRAFDQALAAHSRGKRFRLSDRAQQRILAVQQQWLDYELDGNMTGVVSLCVDDVVWLPPNQPALRGKSAVAAWLAVLPEHRIRRIEITHVQIHGSAGLAYKLADFTTWFEEGGRDSDERVTGSHLWVLRESLPEYWQVAVVAWSTARSMNAALA